MVSIEIVSKRLDCGSISYPFNLQVNVLDKING
jgi:hypothetical protein